MPLYRVTICRTSYAYATHDVIAPDEDTARALIDEQLPSSTAPDLMLEWATDDASESVVFCEEIGPDDAAPQGEPPVAT